MRFKDYILIIPIVLICVASAVYFFRLLSQIGASATLANQIEQQRIIKTAMRDITAEQMRQSGLAEYVGFSEKMGESIIQGYHNEEFDSLSEEVRSCIQGLDFIYT